MNGLPGQVQETEKKPALQEAGSQPEGEGEGGQEKRETPSILEMLFREAEVIAQNLKESGTRR